MHSRLEDIQSLLRSSEGKIQDIQKQYEASLHAQEIPAVLQVEIKNLCENLRSVLDYLASDIHDTYCRDKKPRFYFPILSSREVFETKVEQWFPALRATAPSLWEYLESLQPYHDLFKWLGILAEATNQNKHDKLVPQTRFETEQVQVRMAAGGSVTWNPRGVRFGAGVSIGGVPVDPKTQLPVPHPSQKVERVLWVDFLFEGLNISALGLVKTSLKGITDIVGEIAKWL